MPVKFELNLTDHPVESDTLALSAAQVEALQQTEWTVPGTVTFQGLREPLVGDNPWEAASLGVEKTGQFISRTYVTLVRLVQGSIGLRHLRGPVGILDEGTQIAQRAGWQYMLFFLGLISVNLAVINFLPIPLVDGGHILFLLIEKVKGSPVSVRVQVGATYVGLALIAFVFLATLFYDVTRLFNG